MSIQKYYMAVTAVTMTSYSCQALNLIFFFNLSIVTPTTAGSVIQQFSFTTNEVFVAALSNSSSSDYVIRAASVTSQVCSMYWRLTLLCNHILLRKLNLLWEHVGLQFQKVFSQAFSTFIRLTVIGFE